jgi:hypothetical protein
MPVEIVTPPIVPGGVGAEPFPGTSGMLTFEADAMLWFIPNVRRAVPIAQRDFITNAVTLGQLDTVGDEHLDRHTIPGGRFGLGYWWMTDNPWMPGGKLPTYGAEARYLFLGQRTSSSLDEVSPTLVRPFFDLNNAKVSQVIVAAPGLATGSLSGRVSERMWGTEGNLWCNLYYDWPGTTCTVDGMIGVRYLELNEGVHLARASLFAAAPVGFPDFAFLAGNRINEQESFVTRNGFIGAQLGLRGNLIFDRVVVSGQAQLGLGNTNESINIQGSQLRTLPTGQKLAFPGALLALPSNIGHHSHNEFTEVPELNLKLAFPINHHLTVALGFTALYWSRIARPADQLDRGVDITQIPSFPGAATAVPTGLARPTVPFTQSDLWLLGGMISVELKW